MICGKYFILILFFAFVGISYSDDYPIIFVHGPEDNPTDTKGWKTWNNPHSAMWSILNEQYGGYTAGNPQEFDESTLLSSIGGETRKIYNFSFYHPDGNSSSSIIRFYRLLVKEGFFVLIIHRQCPGAILKMMR